MLKEIPGIFIVDTMCNDNTLLHADDIPLFDELSLFCKNVG